MSSDRIKKMATSWLYTVINLYLENPGTGEFTWEKIEDNLVKRHITDNGKSVLFRKGDFEGNMPDIIRELRDSGVNVVRKWGYYKIVNIDEVIKSNSRASISHFQKPRKYKERWAGSGIVGGEVK
jgi:hypothetical protein